MSCIHYKFKSSLDYKTVSFEGLSVTLTNLKRLILEKEGIRTADFDLKVSNAQTGKEYTEDGGPIMRHTSVVVARVPADSQRRLPKVWDRSTEGVVVSSSSSNDLVGFSSLLKTGKNMTEEERIKLMEKESTREYDPSKYCKKNVTLTGTPPPSYLCNRCGQTGHWIKFCPTLNVKRTTGIPKNELLETTPDDPQAMMTSIGTFAVPVLHKNAFLIGKKEKPFISEEDESHGKPAETIEKEPLPTELLCSLCDNILKDAVVIPCCGFSFCDQCIRKHLLGKQECPNCQEPAVVAASLIPNGQLRMAVLKYRREKDCQNKPAAVHIPMATAAMKHPQPLPNTSNAVGCKNVAKNSTGGTTTAVQDGGGSGAFASKRENLLSSKAVKPTVGGHGGGVEQKMNPLTKLTHMVPRCIASHSNNATAVNNSNTLIKLNQKNTGISPATTVTSGGGTLKSSAMSSMTAASPAATFLGVAGSNANNAAVVGGANGNNIGGGNGGTGAAGGGGGALMTTPAAVLRANSPNAPVFPPTIPPYMPQPYYAGFQGLASYPVSIPPPVLPVAVPARPFAAPFPSQPPPPGLYSAGQIDPFSAHFPPANVRPLIDEKPFCVEKSHLLPNRNYRDRDAWDDYLALKDRLRPPRRTSSDSSRSPRRRRKRSRSSHRHSSSYRKSSRDRYRESSKSYLSRRSSSRHRHDSSRGRRVGAFVEEKRVGEKRKYENDHRHHKSDQRRDARDGSRDAKDRPRDAKRKKNVDVRGKEVAREASLKPTNLNNQDDGELNVNKNEQSVVRTSGGGEQSKSIPVVNRQETKRSTAKVATTSGTSTSATVDCAGGKVEATDRRHRSKRSSSKQQQQQHRVKRRRLSSSTVEGKENVDLHHSSLKRKPTPPKSSGSKRRSPATTTTTTTVAGAHHHHNDDDALVSERLEFCELTEIDVYTLSECEKSASDPTPASVKANSIQQQQPKSNNAKATTTVELKERRSSGCQQQQQQQQQQAEKKKHHGQPPAVVSGDARGRNVAEKTHDKKLHRECSNNNNNNSKEVKRDEHRPKKGGDNVVEKRNRDERPKASPVNAVVAELPADAASTIVADDDDSGGGGGDGDGDDVVVASAAYANEEEEEEEEDKGKPEKQQTTAKVSDQQEQPDDQEDHSEDQDRGREQSLHSASPEKKKEKKRKRQKRKRKKKDRKVAASTAAAASSGAKSKKKKKHRRRRRRQRSRHRRHRRRRRSDHHRSDESRDQSSSLSPPRQESKRHHRKKRSKRDDHVSDRCGDGGQSDKKDVKYSKRAYASSSTKNRNNNRNSRQRHAQYYGSSNHEDLPHRTERRWDPSEEEGRTSSRRKSEVRYRRHRYH